MSKDGVVLVKGGRFWLTTPTLGIQSVEGQHVPITLNANAIVEIISHPIDGNPLVEIKSDGKILLMFKQDLEGRGQEV